MKPLVTVAFTAFCWISCAPEVSLTGDDQDVGVTDATNSDRTEGPDSTPQTDLGQDTAADELDVPVDIPSDPSPTDGSSSDGSAGDPGVSDSQTDSDTTPSDVEDTADSSDLSSDMGTDLPDSDVEDEIGTPPEGENLNPGWIGGACDSSGDCDHSDPICLTDGFPDGMCTQVCSLSAGDTWICPDTDYGPTTMNTVSRCIDTGTGLARCVSECDFEKSPTGCRTGYVCVLRQRYGQPNTIFPVCLPWEPQGWPGEPDRPFDIGESCVLDSDCSHRYCMELPNGYCTLTMCEWARCPGGSTCFEFDEGDFTACLRDCSATAECREDEGYVCDTDDTCWPDYSRPTWDSSVGAGDCAEVWAGGLSPCDATPDDYVVVNKSARNLALCHEGSLLSNHEVGLGFAPLGDKRWEGDGRTPEGVFYVARMVPASSYHLALLLSYPDQEDAERGFAAGEITAEERSAIINAQNSCNEPPQYTALGGLIEVHGGGGSSDWTAGCIAITNDGMDALWAIIGTRETIVVLP